MRIRRATFWLLTLALLLGQWLALAHDFTHPALADDSHCQVCVHAPGLNGVPLAAAAASTLLAPQHESLPAVAAPAARRAHVGLARIRGPPLIN